MRGFLISIAAILFCVSIAVNITYIIKERRKAQLLKDQTKLLKDKNLEQNAKDEQIENGRSHHLLVYGLLSLLEFRILKVSKQSLILDYADIGNDG